jgi:hypothetical protein
MASYTVSVALVLLAALTISEARATRHLTAPGGPASYKRIIIELSDPTNIFGVRSKSGFISALSGQFGDSVGLSWSEFSGFSSGSPTE